MTRTRIPLPQDMSGGKKNGNWGGIVPFAPVKKETDQ